MAKRTLSSTAPAQNDQNVISWADQASLDLGHAWGLAFMCSSFLAELGAKQPEEKKAAERAAAHALQYIAATASSVAMQCEAAPLAVRDATRCASGVAALVASEAVTEYGMQYRDDITDWAVNALAEALEKAKAALNDWIDGCAKARHLAAA